MRPYLKITIAKRAEDMIQALEHLPSKCKAMSSKPSTSKQTKNQNKQKQQQQQKKNKGNYYYSLLYRRKEKESQGPEKINCC
jgi:hypothetical protein